jgi:hypothetical protein
LLPGRDIIDDKKRNQRLTVLSHPGRTMMTGKQLIGHPPPRGEQIAPVNFQRLEKRGAMTSNDWK